MLQHGTCDRFHCSKLLLVQAPTEDVGAPLNDEAIFELGVETPAG